MYLFEGISENVKNPVDLNQSTYGITSSLIVQGMQGIVKRDSKYRNEKHLPYSRGIFKNMPGLEKLLVSFSPEEYAREKRTDTTGRPIL